MAKKPSHANIPEIELSTRIPQCNGIRTAKPSKIAKPSGIVGNKLSALPKSLSNEKICQASNLVQNTTKTLFKSRFGKPPEPKPRAKMNSQPNQPVGQDMTFDITRPTLTRSDTFDKIEPTASQNVDVGNNLTQNVISKLQEQTFTTASNPMRMSISPIAPSHQFAVPRQISDKVKNPASHISSTPFRNIPTAKFSTKNLCEQQNQLPPISFDITGTDQTAAIKIMEDLSPQLNILQTIADTTEPSSMHFENLTPCGNTGYGSMVMGVNKMKQLNSKSESISPFINYAENIADTTEPSFFTQCEPVTPHLPSREKFHVLAENLVEENLIDETMTNFYTTMASNQNTILSKTLEDESTIKAESNASSSTSIDVPNKQRFSFGQDITEWTLDCSIELYDSSVGSSAANAGSPSHVKKQHSFDEKSLSILTPDQMKEFLDSNNTNLNLDLPLFPKMPLHQCRIDQTPSPEELPLDPVGVKTDIPDLLTVNDNQITTEQYAHEQQMSQTDSYSKTDQMTKSAASKVSNSFITSVTSITSLDNGYQGDGEMSRPASRGGDHSPSNMPRTHSMRPAIGREPLFMNNNQNNVAIVRRQDPMTDSDFFTESDADDIVNRGDRRAQVIDGQLYAPMVQGANINHYVNQQPSTEDSCMESSGIFTDVENRADDRHELDSDMSPDGSTDTIKSSNTEYNNKKNSTVLQAHTDTFVNHQGHSMSDSTTSSTINSSCEKEQKHNKNEANVALKKHEMSKSRRVSGEKLRNASSSGVLSSVDVENQENKRPATGGCARKVVPNKWDAVMNKIASNKTNVKSKNYNAVKSKVTCGLTKKDSPGLLKSPTVEDDLFVATSKRNFLLSSKRGRTHSQQSSQSDISENVGSSKTKIRANSSSSPRAAKKRDVRAITSPNDLANAKSNGKCGAIKSASLQKRLSNGSSNGAVSSSPTEQKSSPPPKKFLSKRSTQSASSKTPLKDHNRLSGSGTPTTTTKLQATPRKIDISPKGTISPKTPQRVILSQTSSHSIRNAAIHHTNDIVQNDRIFNNNAHTNANQVDRIVNNGKIDNCLNGVGSTHSVITTTRATSTIDVVDANLIHANKGVAALGVVVKYLVDDLDAFNTPNLKKLNENVTKELMETKLQLENSRQNYTKLECQLAENDENYKIRQHEIHDQYKSELSKLENRFGELDQTSNARIASLEKEIASKEKEYEQTIENVTSHFKATIAEKDEKLALAKNNEDELLKRIKALSSTENELREKVLASETEFGERLQLAALRERELTEKFNALNKSLVDQLTAANNEILVLRSSSVTENVTEPKAVKDRPMTLENEIQSWRSVLEMKQKEVSDLQKQNHDLQKNAAALPGALAKISGLESRLEDLTIQLKIKTDEEQELLQKNLHLEQSYKQEIKNRSIVALDNEQLKYRLKTNTEKFSSALIELAKGHNDTSTLSESSNSVILNGSDVSPPTTPVVKGVVEKNASVSYVLEINDEESPEALASRIIRRAGSFRQNANDRQRLIQQGNALTQSASATSILRQHSETGTPRSSHNSIRTRSKSVSTNSNNASSLHEEKQLQSNKRDKLNVPTWNAPLCSSSPNSKRSIQTANNSNDNDLLLSEESEAECSSVSRPNADKGPYFRRSNSYKHTKRGLITCNTAALTSQRPELCLSLPVHPTVKELKKFQQIKESAGEAMVSGTNSEDEASTASSDGSLSSRSSSSGRRRSSIEDANIDKIVASLGVGDGTGNSPAMGLIGTPMEVSWSEDIDHFASDSAV